MVLFWCADAEALGTRDDFHRLNARERRRVFSNRLGVHLAQSNLLVGGTVVGLLAIFMTVWGRDYVSSLRAVAHARMGPLIDVLGFLASGCLALGVGQWAVRRPTPRGYRTVILLADALGAGMFYGALTMFSLLLTSAQFRGDNATRVTDALLVMPYAAATAFAFEMARRHLLDLNTAKGQPRNGRDYS